MLEVTDRQRHRDSIDVERIKVKWNVGWWVLIGWRIQRANLAMTTLWYVNGISPAGKDFFIGSRALGNF